MQQFYHPAFFLGLMKQPKFHYQCHHCEFWPQTGWDTPWTLSLVTQKTSKRKIRSENNRGNIHGSWEAHSVQICMYILYYISSSNLAIVLSFFLVGSSTEFWGDHFVKIDHRYFTWHVSSPKCVYTFCFFFATGFWTASLFFWRIIEHWIIHHRLWDCVGGWNLNSWSKFWMNWFNDFRKPPGRWHDILWNELGSECHPCPAGDAHKRGHIVVPWGATVKMIQPLASVLSTNTSTNTIERVQILRRSQPTSIRGLPGFRF